VRNEEVLLTVKEERNTLQKLKGKKTNWFSHILPRNCFLKDVIDEQLEGRAEVTR
jgi:hypothetical protein